MFDKSRPSYLFNRKIAVSISHWQKSILTCPISNYHACCSGYYFVVNCLKFAILIRRELGSRISRKVEVRLKFSSTGCVYSNINDLKSFLRWSTLRFIYMLIFVGPVTCFVRRLLRQLRKMSHNRRQHRLNNKQQIVFIQLGLL